MFSIKVLDLVEQLLYAEACNPVSAGLEKSRKNPLCQTTTEQVPKRKGR